MSFKYITTIFFLLVSIGKMEISTSEDKSKSKLRTSITQEEIITSSYCNLVNHQLKYDHKLVRVRVIVLTWMDGTSLYDQECEHEGFEPILDCTDEKECFVMRKLLEKEMEYKGDIGRVEAVLIGRLITQPNTAKGKSRSKLMIKAIERVMRVHRDSPWPGEPQ